MQPSHGCHRIKEPYSHYLPDEPGKDSGAPIIGWVIGNTNEHFDLHREWIENLTKE